MSWLDNQLAKFRSVVGRPRAIESEQTVAEGNIMGLAASMRGIALPGVYTQMNDDELLRRQGFKVYREMMADDTVKASIAFKKVLITGRQWAVVPSGGKDANETQKKYAAFVTDALQRINTVALLREALSAFQFGFSVGEINWVVERFGEDDQLKVLLKEVKFRDPQFIWIDVDVHGNIVQFRQQAGYQPAEAVLKPDKVFHYAYQRQFSNHYGTSDLRAAYAPWWSKKYITQFWNVFLERFGSPLMMMKYPQGADQVLKNSLVSILQSLSSRSDILVPEGVKVELVEATRGGNAGYGEALTYCDIRIGRAILVPALLGMGTDIKRGADSQSRLHLRVMMKVANDVAVDLSEIMKCKIIKPLVMMNFAGAKEADVPDFEFLDYGEYEGMEIVDTAINMFNAGMLDADQEDINYLRSTVGLPLREEGDEDEINRPMPAPLGDGGNNPNASGAGAGKNNARSKTGPSTKVNKPQQ